MIALSEILSINGREIMQLQYDERFSKVTEEMKEVILERSLQFSEGLISLSEYVASMEERDLHCVTVNQLFHNDWEKVPDELRFVKEVRDFYTIKVVVPLI